MTDPRGALPSMTALLRDPAIGERVAAAGRGRVVAALRATLGEARTPSASGPVADHDDIVTETLATLDAEDRARSTRLLNGTGVVLHTNLGRAPLSEAAVAAMVAAAGASNVEYDLTDGRRGGRGGTASAWLARLCGADDAIAVNNGAGALMLAVAALATGRKVVVSRGELVEIGGSFRLPEILQAAGAVLHEVGTTNRTHVADYERAIEDMTGALLRVHASNYRIEGFVAAPTDLDLAEVAAAAGVPFVYDLGSGLLAPSDHPALRDEPDATSALQADADLVVFSGDKLLGGPQAGVIAGDARLVERCRRHPLARALRVDKARLAALEATLDAYLRDDRSALPAWAQLEAEPRALQLRAKALADTLDLEVVPTTSVPGGGALPGVTLPSWGLRLPGPPDDLAAAFRRADPPVVGRVDEGAFVLDLRSVPPADDDALHDAVAAVLGRGPSRAEGSGPSRRDDHDLQDRA